MICITRYEKLSKQFTQAACLAVAASSYVVGIWIAPVLPMAVVTAMLLFELYVWLLRAHTRKKYGEWKPDRDNPAEVDRYDAFLKNMRSERARKRLPVMAIVLTVLFIGTLTLDPAPWLPAEELTISGAAPVTAYVLSTSADFTAVMTAGLPRIEYIPTQSVTRRRLCVLGFLGPGWRSLPELTLPARYPSCSSLGAHKSAHS
jgi:hypothetical protein